MASIRERVGKGHETTYAVLFRQGSRQTSLTLETRKQAEAFKTLVDAFGADRALKMHREEETRGGLTVAELGEKFLEWKARDVTERTIEDYRRDFTNWIVPWLGHLAAEHVDEGDVQRWVDHMAENLAPKSVAGRHTLLHSIYQYGKARSRRLVSHNPCLETNLPAKRRKRPKGTTVAQWRSILDVAAESNPDARDLILYLGSVGWRFSEAIALPVGAVEVRGDRVWVDMVQVFRIVSNRQVLTPDAAKSFAGFRRVPVPNRECEQMLLRRCVGKAPDDFVFTNRLGNHWSQQTFLRDTWPSLLKGANLWHGPRKSPTPHWLRHMAVAVLFASGADAEEVRRYVGHESSSTTTGTYGGLMGGLSTGVLEQTDRILSGKGPKGMIVVGEVVTRELG